jgi:hypothetical protein
MISLKRVVRGRALGSLCCVLALAGSALLSSCAPGPALATIAYGEASVCGANVGFHQNEPDSQVILVFVIISITNTGSNATSFAFKPNLLYLRSDNGDNDYAGTTHGLSAASVPYGFAQPQTVPAGATHSGYAAVVVADTAPNGSSISGWGTNNFQLYYATPAGTEGVLMVKKNSNAARYPTRAWGCPLGG